MAFPFTRHRIWQLVVDGALVAAAWWLAFQLRFDSGVPPYYDTLFSRTILIVVAIKLATFVVFGFYNRWWRYVSTRDMWKLVQGVVVGSLLTYLVLYAFPPEHTSRLPRRVAALDLLLLLALVCGSRLLARTLLERPQTGVVAH